MRPVFWKDLLESSVQNGLVMLAEAARPVLLVQEKDHWEQSRAGRMQVSSARESFC